MDFMLKADGFDSPTGQFPINIWEKYTSEMYELIGIKSEDKILEIEYMEFNNLVRIIFP